MGLRKSIRGLFRARPSEPPATVPNNAAPPRHIFWAMRNIPIQDANHHFLVVGSPQSGKTLTIRMLMQSVLPYIGRGFGHRALVYDAKRELYPLLTHMRNQEPITLDPFDERGHPWAMAEDLTTDADAAQVAGMLIPTEEHASQPFFSDAARELLRAVLVAFMDSASKEWTLRDVLLALEHVEKVRSLLHKSEMSWRIAAPYLEDEQPLPSVMSTIATKLQRFSVVAALWAKSKNDPVSLTKWLDTESVLIIASHPRFSESLRPINQIIFRRLSDLVLSRPDVDPKDKNPWRTWFFLDEVREADQLNGLHPLLNMGRSKGACVVLGFQDIAGMQAVYGDKIADELVGQCGYKTVLRTTSQAAASWAQSHFGQTQQLQPKFSFSQNYDQYGALSGTQQSVSYDRALEPALLASEFMSIPPPGPEHGFIGYHDTPRHGSYRTAVPWDWVMKYLWEPPSDPDKPVPKVSPRADKKQQRLDLWEDKDFKRLWPEEHPGQDKGEGGQVGGSPVAPQHPPGPTGQTPQGEAAAKVSPSGEAATPPEADTPKEADSSPGASTVGKSNAYQKKLDELGKIKRSRG